MLGSSVISVVISTYNAPEFLAVSLSSFQRQTDRGFEIVVADDGSDPRTAQAIAAAQAPSPVPISHVRHADRGFRLSRIRNLAIGACTGNYVIFLDGDCFVLEDFIALHRRLAETGKFVSGKRSYLRPGLTQRIMADAVAPRWGRGRWLWNSLGNQCTRPAEFAVWPDGAWRDRRAGEWRKAQACNLGAFRSDIDTVNGFDNRYEAHGLEDSDFVLRLIHAGIARKLGDHGPVVLHLAHPRRGDGGPSPNTKMFEALVASGATRADNGLVEAIAAAD